jgi:signal transduction histidine kinase
MPLVIGGIADFLEDPGEVLSGQSGTIAWAMELGALRYTQGFSQLELHKEYQLLGSILFAFLVRAARESRPPSDLGPVLECAHRLFQAIAVVQQATTAQFLQQMTSALAERENRLEAFHRALTHEMRNRVGATLGAAQVLDLPGLDQRERGELTRVIARNAETMRAMLENLLELSRAHAAPRQQRHVRLRAAVTEAVRQFREASERAAVVVRIAPTLPDVEVNAAAVELVLANYLSNAIKYSDPDVPERRVEVRGTGPSDGLADHVGQVVIEVVDNGRGVPNAQRSRLFERFYRAHEATVPAIDGTGLGLSVVRETVGALGGQAWAEFPEGGGAIFAFSLPCRRAADLAMSEQPADANEP